MKWKLYFIPVLIAAFVMASCSDETDDFGLNDVPAKVMETFNAQYPHTMAHWERERGKIKAEFAVDGQEAEAWYEDDGTWIGTETNFRGSFPEPVQHHIRTHYAGYTVDDADWIDTPTLHYFDIDLEMPAKPDVRLLIQEDGTLVGPA